MPLTYLLKIAHGRFPVEVTSAPEIKRVSILKATGLIEARISSAVGGGGIYRKAEIAVVFGLTDEGRRELFAMRSNRPATLSDSSQRALERRQEHPQAQPAECAVPARWHGAALR